jgi:hypothetical protein
MADAIAKGVYNFKQIRDGKVIDSWTVDNIVPTEGLNYLLNAGYKNAPQMSNWYIGLFSGNYTPVSTDTASTFSQTATEVTAGYNENTRQLANFSSSTSAYIDNSSSLATFTFNNTVTVYGSFISSSSAKGSTTGVLGSAARFPSAKSMTSGDLLQVTYALSLTSA